MSSDTNITTSDTNITVSKGKPGVRGNRSVPESLRALGLDNTYTMSNIPMSLQKVVERALNVTPTRLLAELARQVKGSRAIVGEYKRYLRSREFVFTEEHAVKALQLDIIPLENKVFTLVNKQFVLVYRSPIDRDMFYLVYKGKNAVFDEIPTELMPLFNKSDAFVKHISNVCGGSDVCSRLTLQSITEKVKGSMGVISFSPEDTQLLVKLIKVYLDSTQFWKM